MIGIAGPRVWEEGGGIVVAVNGAVQSFVSLTDPRDLRYQYSRIVARLLHCWAEGGGAGPVVHLGGAGMTIPRYVSATLGVEQIVVDPDEVLMSLVLARAPLDPTTSDTIELVTAYGEDYLRTLPDGSVGALVIDAFTDGTVPPTLLTWEFLDDVARVLARDGLVTMCLADHPENRFARHLAARWVARLGIRGRAVGVYPAGHAHFGNVVLAAAPAFPPDPDLIDPSALLNWIGDSADHSAVSPRPPTHTLGTEYGDG